MIGLAPPVEKRNSVLIQLIERLLLLILLLHLTLADHPKLYHENRRDLPESSMDDIFEIDSILRMDHFLSMANM